MATTDKFIKHWKTDINLYALIHDKRSESGERVREGGERERPNKKAEKAGIKFCLLLSIFTEILKSSQTF